MANRIKISRKTILVALGRKLLSGLGLLVVCSVARAEVTGINITQRADLGSSGYEKVFGTIHFAIDPKNPRNAVIVDLDRAPLDAKGRVEFISNFKLIKPKDMKKGNGAAVIIVSNRGGGGLLSYNRGKTSDDPRTDADLGDQFLMRRGFTTMLVGWEFDVPRKDGAMWIKLPAAGNNDQPVTGIVTARFTPNESQASVHLTDLADYPPVDEGGPLTRLVVCPGYKEPGGEDLPRSSWKLKGNTVTLEGGFKAGQTYQIWYRAANPPISGLGFAAFRDAASWLRYALDSIAPVRYLYSFGASQSGRFLRDFVYEGFNTDEQGRQVFDGLLPHIAGASRLDVNSRWATPRRLGQFDSTNFPFADAALDDPVTGAHEGLLENPRVDRLPKIFYTDTGNEYWGGGRVAALIHTDPMGARDLVLPSNIRMYFISGSQHGPGVFPPHPATQGQQRENPNDFRWVLRALLVAMHRWVSEGVTPPASAYPTLRNGTLVWARDVAFPEIPGVQSPRTATAGYRAINLNSLIPGGAGAGAPLPLLVSQVDPDGNELAGIRLPAISVPLATYTGWNFRNRALGAPEEFFPLRGSWIPFAPTKTARSASRDPRLSIQERYSSKDEYLAKYRAAAEALAGQGYLLPEDIPLIVARGGVEWDFAVSGASRN